MDVRRAVLVACSCLFGCAAVQNFDGPGPVYVSSDGPVGETVGDSLLVVSYNIKFSDDVFLARRDLMTLPSITDADVVLLQEVGPLATADLARSLDLHYVYAPVSLHPKSRNGWFGNAILSRVPLRAPRKIPLPWQSHQGQRRHVLVAHLEHPSETIAVATAHTSTLPIVMHRQWKALADSLAVYDGQPLIVGGDFNDGTPFSSGPDGFLAALGLDRATHIDGASKRGWLPMELDKIYSRDVEILADGIDRRSLGSDHFPVWALLRIRE